MIKLLKASDKEKISKTTRGKETHYILKNKGENYNRFHMGNNASQKTVE